MFIFVEVICLNISSFHFFYLFRFLSSSFFAYHSFSYSSTTSIMSAAIVLDDNHSIIRFYTHDSPQAVQEMLKSVKTRIAYFGLHMGPLTLKFTDCMEFVTLYRDYSPPTSTSTSTTTPSTPLLTPTSPANIDRSLYTLLEQQKYTAIISVALIFIFLALFSCILCRISRIIRKKTSHRTLSESKFLL